MSAKRRPARLVLYNHKGGVGKTTLTINLAYFLASRGKRVLLVDADPQCNLTSYLVESEVVDSWLDTSSTDKGNTIWTAIRPLFDTGGDVKEITPFERAQNLFLVPGDIRLADFEQDLVQQWTDCLQRKLRGFRAVCAISELVDRLVQSNDYDVVLYDVGPNIGPLNRIVLLDCDFFIVPAACDYFSVRALKTLGASISGWIKDWQLISQLAPDDAMLLKGHPVFLGYVLQRFRMYGGTVSSGYQQYVATLARHIQSDVVSVMKQISPDLAPGTMADHKLGQIKDFGQLASMGQSAGLPLWSIEGGNPSQRVEAKSQFAEFGQKVLARVAELAR